MKYQIGFIIAALTVAFIVGGSAWNYGFDPRLVGPLTASMVAVMVSLWSTRKSEKLTQDSIQTSREMTKKSIESSERLTRESNELTRELTQKSIEASQKSVQETLKNSFREKVYEYQFVAYQELLERALKLNNLATQLSLKQQLSDDELSEGEVKNEIFQLKVKIVEEILGFLRDLDRSIIYSKKVREATLDFTSEIRSQLGNNVTAVKKKRAPAISRLKKEIIIALNIPNINLDNEKLFNDKVQGEIKELQRKMGSRQLEIPLAFDEKQSS